MMDCARHWLTDPVTGEQIEALRLQGGALQITVIPQRTLDLYELRYRDAGISYTDDRAKITPRGFCEAGQENFSAHFFAGMMTTCGLIQAGRPCRENGRSFGLHGCISNTPATRVQTAVLPDRVTVQGITVERHPEGEAMQLTRCITLHQDSWVEIADQVENIGGAVTPFMLMYHINFGVPFLSENLRVSIPFTHTEDRDTGLPAAPEDILKMEPRGSWTREKVYYTQADMTSGARLFDPHSGRECRLTAQGTSWLGIWKNFTEGAYALGIEPCNCPGLGRVNAAKRNLLPYLAPGEARQFRIRLQFAHHSQEA